MKAGGCVNAAMKWKMMENIDLLLSPMKMFTIFRKKIGINLRKEGR